MKKKIGMVTGIIILAVIGGGYFLLSEEKGNITEISAPDKMIRHPVPTATVQVYSGHSRQLFSGKVRATNRAELSFPVAGLIQKINVLEGQKVKRGELLVTIAPKDFRNNYNVSQARYLSTKHDFERAKILWTQKVLSRADYDQAEANCDIAKAELSIKKKALADTRLFAPIDGLVAKRYIQKNEYVKIGTPVLSLQDVSRIEVVFPVSERVIAHGGINILHNIQIEFDAEPNHWINAKIYEFKTESNQTTNTYDIVVTIDNTTGLQILPGMTATVRCDVPTADTITNLDNETTQIPIEAIAYNSDGSAYVWLINPSINKAFKTLVMISSLNQGQAIITRGLSPGDLVAIAGLHSLDEELNIRPMLRGKEGLEG